MSDHLIDYDRAGKITASVVGAILRSDPYHSCKWAWRVVTGREPFSEPGWDARRGLAHESDAIESLEIDFGRIVLDGSFRCHDRLPWLGASPDGFLVESGFSIPIECKCPRKLHSEIPPYYYDQVQTQLEVCDVPYGYFVSWTENGQWVTKVERDAEWWKRSFPILEEFYNEYVAKDVEPPRAARRKNVNQET